MLIKQEVIKRSLAGIAEDQYQLGVGYLMSGKLKEAHRWFVYAALRNNKESKKLISFGFKTGLFDSEVERIGFASAILEALLRDSKLLFHFN